MAVTNEIPSVSEVELQRKALDAVLKSSLFSKNPRLSSLLYYLCQRSSLGEPRPVKEYNIATDVFGRSADFDQSTDAIVRVEMHRLRKKLREFYAAEGADQDIEIVLQAGNYVPEFVWRFKAAAGEPESRTVLASEAVEAVALERSLRHFRVRPQHIALISALMLGIAALAVMVMRQRPEASVPHPHEDARALQPAVIPTDAGIRILAGTDRGTYRDRDGNVWGPDAYFSGGSAVESPDQPIYRTADPRLFRHMRSGEFSYRIPLKPGTYELRLYFADTSYVPGPAMEGGENVRVFNVLMNGEMLLPQFDIIADAGPNTADIRVFKDVSPSSDGYLHLAFSRLTDTPILNAIEIVPGIAHHYRPIRIVTQDVTVTDRLGQSWSPDNYFLGGRIIARYGNVNGPEDPHIYERERYGSFSYAIPVPPGRYAVTLHFAETYWGPKGPGGGGIGSRIFNVDCNGTEILHEFDIFKQVGAHAQVVKTFHNLEPNAQGKLLLNFVPVKNYANISAIDVVEEQN